MTNIQTIAVIGAGTMGGGIAISALAGRFNAILIDASQDALEQAQLRVQKFFNRQVEKGHITPEQARDAQHRLQLSTDMATVSGADLVIEAVFEDIKIKTSVFSRLEKIVASDCHLATNTSALNVSAIGGALRRPERLCGLHFFSPAEINPAVEVVRSEATQESTIAAVLSVLEQCRKTPIECRDHSGFALNRFFCPYTNEAARCLDDGLGTPAQIDAVAKEAFGVPIGPFAVMNIVKPRINLAAIHNLAHLGPFYAPAPSLIACGDSDGSWPLDDAPEPLGKAAHDTIAKRLQGAVFLAVRQALAEQVAAPEAIDLGARKAFAFKTGPVAMMDAIGKDAVEERITLVS